MKNWSNIIFLVECKATNKILFQIIKDYIFFILLPLKKVTQVLIKNKTEELKCVNKQGSRNKLINNRNEGFHFLHFSALPIG